VPPIETVVVPDLRRKAYVFAKGILEEAGFAWRVRGGVRGYAANLVDDQVPAPGTRVVDTGAPTVVLVLRRGSYPQKGAPEDGAPFGGTPLRLAGVAARPAAPPSTAAAGAATRTPDFTFDGAQPEPRGSLPLPDRARNLSRWLASSPPPTVQNVSYWLYQHAWIVRGAKQGWWHGRQALRILIGADRHAEAAWGVGTRREEAAREALAEVRARAR
jgi:hypothetical protein